MCKVQWGHHTEDEATGSMKKNSEKTTKSFFPAHPNLGGEIPFKGGGGVKFVTS
jgi:hypothetical protein